MAKRKFNAREKSMIIITLVLIVILFTKSLVFDEVKNLEGAELKFSKFVEYTIDETYQGALFENNIIVIRTTKIFLADDEVKTKIGYMDDNGEYVEEVLDGRYTAVTKHYLFGVLPFKQKSISTPIFDETK